MLESTLVVWGGEFGRTPMSEIRRPEEVDNAGRDHHSNGFSLWLAGGGIKGGQVIDRCGYSPSESAHMNVGMLFSTVSCRIIQAH